MAISCGTATHRLPEHATTGDGHTLTSSQFRWAIVGSHTGKDALDAQALVADVQAYDPHITLFSGGFLTRGSVSSWRSFTTRWSALGGVWLAPVDRFARKSDRRAARWRHVFSDPSVTKIDGATWWFVDLQTQGVRWRLVVLDSDRVGLGDRWQDQRTWLPKVVSGSDYDHLVVVSPEPEWQLSDGGRHREDVADLIEIIDDHAGPVRLMAVISGGTSTQEAMLPGGSFGPVHVVAGNAGVPNQPLLRTWGTSLSLIDGFDATLMGLATQAGQDDLVRRMGEYPEDLIIQGWWTLELNGHDLQLGFRAQNAGSFTEIYRIRYAPSTGWVSALE